MWTLRTKIKYKDGMTLDANLETIMLKNKLKTIIWNLTFFFFFCL